MLLTGSKTNSLLKQANQRIESLEAEVKLLYDNIRIINNNLEGQWYNFDRRINELMSQLDDFKAAVSVELTDVQALLAQLATMTQPVSDPAVQDLISQLQASHAAIQAVLTPAPTPAP